MLPQQKMPPLLTNCVSSTPNKTFFDTNIPPTHHHFHPQTPNPPNNPPSPSIPVTRPKPQIPTRSIISERYTFRCRVCARMFPLHLFHTIQTAANSDPKAKLVSRSIFAAMIFASAIMPEPEINRGCTGASILQLGAT